MSRVGLGRHGHIEDDAGDPLDGLVNLFDIGVVLAVAFLVAGLGLAVDTRTGRIEPRAASGASPATTQQPRTAGPTLGGRASGRGTPVGTLYRLSNGQFVVVGPDGTRAPVQP